MEVSPSVMKLYKTDEELKNIQNEMDNYYGFGIPRENVLQTNRLKDFQDEITDLLKTTPFSVLCALTYNVEPMHMNNYNKNSPQYVSDRVQMMAFVVRTKSIFDEAVIYFLDDAAKKIMLNQLTLEKMDMDELFQLFENFQEVQGCLLSWSCFVNDSDRQFIIRPISAYLFYHCVGCYKSRFQHNV